jgi:hypothetical protein
LKKKSQMSFSIFKQALSVWTGNIDSPERRVLHIIYYRDLKKFGSSNWQPGIDRHFLGNKKIKI